MSRHIKLNHETDIEGVTISHGHFSNAGNIEGFFVEKATIIRHYIFIKSN
jgi:mRNA degradation ribonuclease J1/J2